MKDLLKWYWCKLLRGNVNVNKLHSFVDFRVPLNYNFELCTFPISAAQIVVIGGKWVESRKDGWVLQKQRNSSDRRKSGIMIVLGDREREASLLHSLSLCAQRIKPRPFIQPIIKFIFSPHFVGLKIRAMRHSETLFCLSNFETKQKSGIFTRGIGKSEKF